eukprot:5069759-Pyramimonas_sp.AAC.1
MSDKVKLSRAKEAYPGNAARLAKLAEQPNGHKLAVFDRIENESFIIACQLCGKYSECTVKSLQMSCLQRFTSNFSEGAYARLAEGRHPRASKTSPIVFKPPIPIDMVATQAAQAL